MATRVACNPCLIAFAIIAGGCGGELPGVIPLTLVDSAEIATDAGERVQRLTFRDGEGQEVAGVLREPGASAPSAAVVLVAGRETGQQAAAVIPGPLQQVVLAIEYPAALPDQLPRLTVPALRAIRRGALRMPGLLRGAGAWLADRESVDRSRIVLVGVSYGVPFAAAAAGADTIFRGVALHHGGADLALLFRTNLPVENALLRRAVAGFGAWYLRALEPARHVGRIAPRPLLLVNGSQDRVVPRASADALLAAARLPVRQVWLPHGHLMPDDFAHMRELADSTLAHFAFLGARSSSSASEVVP